jgi:hypothetical protein
LRALVEKRGFDIAEDEITLFKIFGPPVEGHLPNCGDFTYSFWVKYSKAAADNKQPKPGIPLEEAKKYAIALIDGHIQCVQAVLQIQKPFEDMLVRSRMTSLFPSEIALEKIMLYEAHLGREFDRTLQQLERLRRLKKGQPTPAPIEVKLST